jgi:hypothetical protein
VLKKREFEYRQRTRAWNYKLASSVSASGRILLFVVVLWLLSTIVLMFLLEQVAIQWK